jgi:hypothetical protein
MRAVPVARFVQRAGPDYCDTGLRAGMTRYAGHLYLTGEEQARLDLTGELAITAPAAPATPFTEMSADERRAAITARAAATAPDPTVVTSGE